MTSCKSEFRQWFSRRVTSVMAVTNTSNWHFRVLEEDREVFEETW